LLGRASPSYLNEPALHTPMEMRRGFKGHRQIVVFLLSAPPHIGESVNVSLTRKQKIQKVQTTVLTALTDAQENQILAKALLRSYFPA